MDEIDLPGAVAVILGVEEPGIGGGGGGGANPSDVSIVEDSEFEGAEEGVDVAMGSDPSSPGIEESFASRMFNVISNLSMFVVTSVSFFSHQ